MTPPVRNVLTRPVATLAPVVITFETAAFGARALARGTATAGKTAVKGAKVAGTVAKEGTRKAAQGYVNARGGITKLAGAAKAASDGVKELGGTDSQARAAAAKGMLATFTGSVGDKVRNAVSLLADMAEVHQEELRHIREVVRIQATILVQVIQELLIISQIQISRMLRSMMKQLQA